jgi:hypothetical protein
MFDAERLPRLYLPTFARHGTHGGHLSDAFDMSAEGCGELFEDWIQFGGVGRGHGSRTQRADAIFQPAGPEVRRQKAAKQSTGRGLLVVHGNRILARLDLSVAKGPGGSNRVETVGAIFQLEFRLHPSSKYRSSFI